MTKNRQTGLHQIEKLVPQWNMMINKNRIFYWIFTKLIEWKKILHKYRTSDKELISRIFKEPIQLSNNNNNKWNLNKIKQKIWIDTSPKGLQTHEK